MENIFKLGRNIEHDTRSLTFGFDTTGLEIKDVEHIRLIPILNQGNVGSCTAQAGIGAVNTQPFIQTPSPYYSPDETGALKLYSDNELADYGIAYPPQDSGSSGLTTAKNLQKANMISGFQHTFTLEDALKALTKYPLMIGTIWTSDMFHPDLDGRVHITGALAGGHEYEVYKNDTKLGIVWAHNSWGESWGINGNFYLTWADLATLLSQQGDVIVPFPLIVIPPTPVYKTLRLGSTGELVKTLQTKLNALITAGQL